MKTRIKTASGLEIPYTFVGTFIEARPWARFATNPLYFPSFWEGLSLRLRRRAPPGRDGCDFPTVL